MTKHQIKKRLDDLRIKCHNSGVTKAEQDESFRLEELLSEIEFEEKS